MFPDKCPITLACNAVDQILLWKSLADERHIVPVHLLQHQVVSTGMTGEAHLFPSSSGTRFLVKEEVIEHIATLTNVTCQVPSKGQALQAQPGPLEYLHMDNFMCRMPEHEYVAHKLS
ncbi:hypothetical protein llap_10345 [Limosa lapponica baueri]|uniref:Uncharacterized protein n=1 Tax=Limosa lapponica baueri TaxID=1758121 RepID=A0A2I0U022_LIMLA|nr:hypothetical protein llap_10345 [Limosa lapponica baueri]